jgi:hypothetical protein
MTIWALPDDAVFLRNQFLELLDTRLRLGLAALGAGADPFQFVVDRLLAAGRLAVFLLQALGLLFQIGRVVALVGKYFPRSSSRIQPTTLSRK